MEKSHILSAFFPEGGVAAPPAGDGTEELLSSVLSLCPAALAREVRALASSRAGFCASLSELRLRACRPSSVTLGEGTLPLGTRLCGEEVQELLLRFCRGSLYAYREQLREGYVTPMGGVRVGVSGRAVTENGEITGVCDVTSLVVRFPRFVPGAAAAAVRAFRAMACRRGLLVYSPPGGGKTTLLRDFIAAVSTGAGALRVAAVDCRGEFEGTLPDACRAEILLGYPKARGISVAVRTLSPDVVVCDELGGREEANAVRDAGIGGVPLVASVHASSPSEIFRLPAVGALVREGWFGALCGITRREGSFVLELSDPREAAG